MTIPIQDQILSTAGALFYREGIRAVGIDRIIEEARVAKATLYRHFPSKDHLVAAYLLQRHERVVASLEDVLRTVERPRDQIDTIFQRLFEKAESPDFRGCAFALAVAEHGDSERVVSVARRHKGTILDIFGRITSSAGIPSDETGLSLASRHLALLYEGALATIAVNRDPQAALTARDCALALFDTLYGTARL
ncbi:TetR/AcrR family transcriptional regulator [Rhizobium sp. SGZ-381]|uniref:TetR/AcrR family transcriptional regulator n=1 Tax=Rhizobium sp. SGZ-381 TaxID=3342800 RepID=UPI00367191A5